MINNWKETDRNNFHNTNQNYKLNIFFLFFFSFRILVSSQQAIRALSILKPEMEWRNNQLSSAWLIRVDPAPVT
jgi:hypothetical protein